jgi:hypothetical protein
MKRTSSRRPTARARPAIPYRDASSRLAARTLSVAEPCCQHEQADDDDGRAHKACGRENVHTLGCERRVRQGRIGEPPEGHRLRRRDGQDDDAHNQRGQAGNQNKAESQTGTTRHDWTIARRFAHQDARDMPVVQQTDGVASGRFPSARHPYGHDSGAQQCHNANVQSHAARRRRRLAIALVVAGLAMLLAPVLASAIAPGVAWVAWLARSLPAALVLAGGMVWYRADKVFDRGFEPDETSDDESHDADR